MVDMTVRTNAAGMTLDRKPGVQCGACHEGWPKMTTISVTGMREAAVVCADPRMCRERAIASGVWKSTAPRT